MNSTIIAALVLALCGCSPCSSLGGAEGDGGSPADARAEKIQPCGSTPPIGPGVQPCAYVCAYDRDISHWRWVETYAGCMGDHPPVVATNGLCGSVFPSVPSLPDCGFSCVYLPSLGNTWVFYYTGC